MFGNVANFENEGNTVISNFFLIPREIKESHWDFCLGNLEISI